MFTTFCVELLTGTPKSGGKKLFYWTSSALSANLRFSAEGHIRPAPFFVSYPGAREAIMTLKYGAIALCALLLLPVPAFCQSGPPQAPPFPVDALAFYPL